MRIILSLLLIAVITGVCRAESAASPVRVLILFSYHQQFVSSKPILAGIKAGLSGVNAVIDIEYMDAKRHGDQSTLARFDAWFSEKIKSRIAYDLIIVSDDNALRYVDEVKDRLFANTPVIFTCINDIDFANDMGTNSLMTGVIEKTSIKETIQLARTLQPNLSGLIAVADNTISGIADVAHFQATVTAHFSELETEIYSLKDYSWEELYAALEKLDEDVAILQLTVFEDKNGRVLNAEDMMNEISDHSSVPVYTLRENFVHYGAIGGHVIDFYAQGLAAANMAASVLSGKAVADIAVMQESPNSIVLNHDMLERFNINNKLIPADSTVINQPETIFNQYKNLFIGLFSLIISLLAVLLFILWRNYIKSHIANKINTMLESLDAGVVLVNKDGELDRFNKQFYQLLSITDADIAVGNSLGSLIDLLIQMAPEYESMLSSIQTSSRKNMLDSTRRLVIHTRTGQAIELRCNQTYEGSLVVSFLDVTETFELHQQLSYQARHDALTGLINRREFEYRLNELIRDSAHKEETHVMCYLDLDQFKVINDTCGHQAGDELLRELSQALDKTIRKSDTVARLGGDEFGILLSHCSLAKAVYIAEEIRELISNYKFTWKDSVFSVGVSIGVVLIDNSDVKTVLSAADAACYSAKDKGRNQVFIFHNQDASILQRFGHMQWASKLKQVMENDRFVLYKHSIESVKTREETRKRYEILLRVLDDRNNICAPGDFLAAAERFDLACLVDEYVVRRTLEYIASDSHFTESLALCTINLSGQSVASEKSAELIKKIFRETGVDPGLICFEITETAAISNLQNAISLINVLRDLGCHFALDDFGSGVSSFGYLKNLPVDILKIDGAFVKGMSEDEIDFTMVKSINEIGKIMGLTTIAEYVETQRVLNQLKIIGVDFAQGYFLSKPEPLKNEEALLASSNDEVKIS